MRTFIKRRGEGIAPKIWKIAILDGGTKGQYVTESGTVGGRMKSSYGNALKNGKMTEEQAVIQMANTMVRAKEKLGYVEIDAETDQPRALLFDRLPPKFSSFIPLPIEDGEPELQVIAIRRKPYEPAYLITDSRGSPKIYGKGLGKELKDMTGRFLGLRLSLTRGKSIPRNSLIAVDLVFIDALGRISWEEMHTIMTNTEARALEHQAPERGRVHMVLQQPFFLDGDEVMREPAYVWMERFLNKRMEALEESPNIHLPNTFFSTLEEAKQIAAKMEEGLIAYDPDAIYGDLAFSLDGGFLYPDGVWEDSAI